MSTGQFGRDRPLDGVRIVDVSALAPGPFCTMILADFGAEVVSVERPIDGHDPQPVLFGRGKRSMFADLKTSAGRQMVMDLVDTADVFVEGFRPGVMERLGFGPDDLLARRPGLVYARVTGWGQTGPYAMRAGHDINYIAIGGPLGIVGTDAPVPPANFVGDFAGGSLMAVIGILLALRVSEASGVGQVVDAAMVDGAALMTSGQLEISAREGWGPRGTNLTDGGAPFYGTYQCADGEWFAVGAIEAKFYAAFLQALSIDDVPLAEQNDVARWPALRTRVAAIFASRTRDEWTQMFADIEGCGTPVLRLDELVDDPHVSSRGSIVMSDDNEWVAAPAPRLSGTPGRIGSRVSAGQHTSDADDQLSRVQAHIASS